MKKSAEAPGTSASLLALVDPLSSEAVAAAASGAGLDVVVEADVSRLLRHLSDRSFAATILSLSVDSMDGTLAGRIGEHPGSGALLLTAAAISLERALLMERAGAVALLREPLDVAELTSRLSTVLDEGPEIDVPEHRSNDEERPLLVGSAPAMMDVFETVARVARTPSTVLVTGESGTGKEVVARILHHESERRSGPFVAVNCAAIPDHLLESELFGHERGAFTGAVARRTGRIQRAHGGTLFLDEIGDMSIVLQAKILRVLAERTLEPVGGEESVPVDVRVVAATNQDLSQRIDEGRFREDLYYRLAVVELVIPPLRNRGEDVRELALHFASEFAQRYERPIRGITEAALARLERHGWPGNVRELRNVIDRAVLLANGGVLRWSDLRLGAGSPRTSGPAPTAAGYPNTLSLEEVESDHIRRVLASVDGHMSRAAEVLGVHRNTLTRKVREFGIGVDESEPAA